MHTPSLRDLQQRFFRGITEGPDAGPLDVIAPSPTLTPAERLDVYAGMYVRRLLDALREDFPRTAEHLGDEAFERVGRDYVARHPSNHPSLRHLGDGLPDFLAAGGLSPFVVELARLERARLDVFDAPDGPVLRRADLLAVAPEDWPALRFAPVDALAVLVTDWPVHRLWKEPGRALDARERTVLRVWRDGFLVYQAPMDAAEEAALARLRAGEPFAAICEGFDDPVAPAGLLLRWIEDGILARAR